MALVINKQPTLAEKIGTGLGQGAGAGIQHLLNNKMNAMLRQQKHGEISNALKQLGIPGHDQLAALDPTILKSIVDYHQKKPEKESYANIARQVLGGGTEQQTPARTPQEQEFLEKNGISGNQIAQQGESSNAQGLPQTPGAINIPKGTQLGERQLDKLLDLSHKKQSLAQAEQHHIDKMNAPELKSIEDKAVPARQTVKLAREALDIVNTGKAITGVAGRITPEFLQSAEGQELLSKLNQIVLTRSQLGKGVPTRLRLALEQGAKAQIWQHPKVIKNILQNMIDDPEIQKDIAYDTAREKLTQKYGSNQPKNFKAHIAREAQDILKNRPGSNEFTDLPPAAKFDGKIATNPKTGQKKKSVGGEWVDIKEGE